MRIFVVALLMVLGAFAFSNNAFAASTKAQGPKKVELPRTFVGSLTSVDTVTGEIVIDAKKKGTVTVTITDTTPLVDSEGNTLSLSDLTVGDKVKAQGTYKLSTSTFTTVKQVKDLNLPVVTPTPTP